MNLPRDKGRRLAFEPIEVAAGDDHWSRGYTIRPARYAKGMCAIRAPGTPQGDKCRAARVLSGLGARYTNRERAYIVSPAKAERFAELYASGADASLDIVGNGLGWKL